MTVFVILAMAGLVIVYLGKDVIPVLLASRPESEVRAASKNEQLMTIAPQEAIAGTFQDLTIEFTPGSESMAIGGGLRIELPVAYGETEPYFWSKPQTRLEQGAGYVQASTSGTARILLKSYGIAGGIVECVVRDAPLAPDQKIILRYHGIVQSLARKLTLRAQWRVAETDAWKFVSHPPGIRILPQDAATLTLHTPAEIGEGQDFEMAAVLIDKFGNRAAGYRGTVTFASTDTNSTYLPSYSFSAQDSGLHVFTKIRYQTGGFQRVTASDGRLKAASNFAFVSDADVSYRRYFGDTHFHTGTGTRNRGFLALPTVQDINTTELTKFKGINLGGDHRGNFSTAAEAYRYVRDVARLDFAASSEHDAALFDSLAWSVSQEVSDSFNQPGVFTTFFAYEWTAPIGHHIVLYKDKGNRVFGHQDYDSLPALWAALDAQNRPALTVPHVTWPFRDHQIWQQINNLYRRIGEIYSLWNSRFLVQPNDDPQRFELGQENVWSYQHAWSEGHKMGLVGATDNHLGHPGANNYTIYTQHTGGLAVVLAGDNTRDAIWDAFQNRRTYATTGTKIYLDFTADGHQMGDEYKTGGAPRFSVRVAGTNMIETVEIVKFDGEKYRTIYTVRPQSEISIFQYQDDTFRKNSLYYVRVKQVDEYPGRPFSNTTSEMAWSSPIWITFDN